MMGLMMSLDLMVPTSIHMIEIYDRYGGLIYVSNKINKGWDGKNLDGIDLNEGIYIYNIVVQDVNNKTEIISGQLNLIR